MKKREDVIRDVINGIIAGTIIALLTCCVDKPVKSAEELKAEYLKKEQEEKAIRQEKERMRRGELTYKEAIERIKKVINDENKDVIKATLMDVFDELKITTGAMILDGYEDDDSCIKYLNMTTNEIEEIIGEL